jgi:hypothetical protein
VIIGILVLKSNLRNEVRRFITLLDALYEARCKLAVTAEVSPDDLFFPDLKVQNAEGNKPRQRGSHGRDDMIHAETFAEVHQDMINPFRPNISRYLAADAIEDDPPNRIKRAALPGLTETERMERLALHPNFSDTQYFTNEDENFAYRRAISHLYEMCGDRWWNTKEWSPLPPSQRHWEKSKSLEDTALQEAIKDARSEAPESIGRSVMAENISNNDIFKHGASPFRTQPGPPPRFYEEHAWGVTKWGKRAGAWGQGIDGLKDRHKKR